MPMKPWTYYAAGFAVATSVTLASCGDDDEPIIPTNDAPTIELQNDAGAMLSDTVSGLEPDGLFEVVVSADDPDDNLRTITIERDGVSVPLQSDNVFIGSVSPANTLSANPATLGTDSSGFTRTYLLRTADEGETAVTYTFVVEDSGIDLVGAESAEASVTLVTREVLTPIEDSTSNGIFYNASGQLNGAFDLNEGENVPSNSDMSELQDGGVDTAGTGLWRRVIIAENGATIRSLSPEDTTGFSYGAIEFEEEVRALFDDGTEPTNNRVGPVESGDVFVVNRDDTYWLVQVESVDEDPDANDDGYVINYKTATLDD